MHRTQATCCKPASLCMASALPPQPESTPWYQRITPFDFLRNGPKSSQPTSPIFKPPGLSPPISSQEPGAAQLEPESTEKQQQAQRTTRENDKATREHRFPSWSTWKDWKKLTFDLYIRLSHPVRDSRLRLKQTIAILPIVKLKPVIDFEYRGQGVPPVSMHLDVKLLDCIKYRLRQDGSGVLQVRAKAPLSDPRFAMDVIYERDLRTDLEGVKISFRAMQVGFLKAPGFGAGVKVPVQLNDRVKSTLRVKQYLKYDALMSAAQQQNSRPSLLNSGKRYSAPRRATVDSNAASSASRLSRFRLAGPIGMDLKLRYVEIR